MLKTLQQLILIFNYYYLSLQFSFDANRLRDAFVILRRN